MKTNLIKFHSCHPENKNTDKFKPSAVKAHIPQWYLDKDKHKKNPDGQYTLSISYKNGETDISRIPSWKSCPAMLDIFLSGYYLFTPCDIEVKNNPEYPEKGGPVVLEFDPKWGTSQLGMAICRSRGIEEGLPFPDGYYEHTYIWTPNWFIEVPEGYTALVSHPININALPFKTISGFIDASNILVSSGNFPFYVKEGWTGIIPAGTPYAQIIPIKNESWESDIVEYTDEELDQYLEKRHREYMVGHGLTKYKELDWLKKHYE